MIVIDEKLKGKSVKCEIREHFKIEMFAINVSHSLISISFSKK